MKVLFAVSNEEISESIVKKYQKEYKQIISYKNVYYFNAILKEIQKDKTYDRIVISEDLEAYTNTQYDQIDKFIFDTLDSISDEASNAKGSDTPIILICSDRRTKSEQMLVKLFGIGIYDAIIGNDRSIEEVCRLINKPRSKKEAKAYYNIESDKVKYEQENENDVTEMEIQNIRAYYKRLGKNEEKFVEAFKNIASQYNDKQLRVISKFLPLNVRAVLEEKSQEYQKIMSFNNTVSDVLREKQKANVDGPSERLLKPKEKSLVMKNSVIIPSSVNMNSTKKLAKPKKKEESINIIEEISKLEIEKEERTEVNEFENEQNFNKNLVKEQEEKEVRRGRGRPRKEVSEEKNDPPIKRKRGRPRKKQEENDEEVNDELLILPGIENLNEEDDILPENEEEVILPGIEEETILPGFDENEEILEVENDRGILENQDEIILPGIEENIEKEENISPLFGNYNYSQEQNRQIMSENIEPNAELNNHTDYSITNTIFNNNIIKEDKEYKNKIDLSKILTSDKKVAAFVGTSKNGTSFIINNVAEIMSSLGINTAILDTTQNRNSYYIYTNNDERLRNIAMDSTRNLAQGIAQGIAVNKNLTVYTSLPDEDDAINNSDEILETLIRNHDLIFIDTDFNTPYGYFKQAQEVYLVQTLDVLTIQPLTAFLKDLKQKNILEEKKLRIILNKNVKIRGITDKTIIGGMSLYNDPAMSFMTELFDRNLIKYVSIPFDEEVYISYLEGTINCKITFKKYPKSFVQVLKELGNMIYPMGIGQSAYRPPSTKYNQDNFSPNINNTLNEMKKRL